MIYLIGFCLIVAAAVTIYLRKAKASISDENIVYESCQCDESCECNNSVEQAVDVVEEVVAEAAPIVSDVVEAVKETAPEVKEVLKAEIKKKVAVKKKKTVKKPGTK